MDAKQIAETFFAIPKRDRECAVWTETVPGVLDEIAKLTGQPVVHSFTVPLSSIGLPRTPWST